MEALVVFVKKKYLLWNIQWKSFLANPQINKWKESSRYFNGFSKGQIWHSQAEEIGHLYVLIMKFFKCLLPLRFTSWHLQTYKLYCQSQGQGNRWQAVVKTGTRCVLETSAFNAHEVSNERRDGINEWTNQPPKRWTNPKEIPKA